MILLCVAIFLINNTVTVGIAVRREEIAIMKLIGATDYLVRAPFIVEGIVIGGHGDTTMIPLPRIATYKGMPICNFLSEEKVEEVVKSTMVGGATLTGLLGTSAWMAPGAAASAVAESIIKNQGKMITCAAYLDGEYGMKDIMIGVPVVLGKNGIERIVEIELTEDEKAKFAASEAAVRKTNAVLYETGILK